MSDCLEAEESYANKVSLTLGKTEENILNNHQLIHKSKGKMQYTNSYKWLRHVKTILQCT